MNLKKLSPAKINFRHCLLLAISKLTWLQRVNRLLNDIWKAKNTKRMLRTLLKFEKCIEIRIELYFKTINVFNKQPINDSEFHPTLDRCFWPTKFLDCICFAGALTVFSSDHFRLLVSCFLTATLVLSHVLKIFD